MYKTAKPKRPKAPWVQAQNRLPELRKWKPVNKSSDRMKERLKEYRSIRADFLSRNRSCAVYSNKKSTQVHHAFGRLGPLLIESKLFIPVSLSGHQWIDANRDDARKLSWMGVPLLAPNGEWNNPKKWRLKSDRENL